MSLETAMVEFWSRHAFCAALWVCCLCKCTHTHLCHISVYPHARAHILVSYINVSTCMHDTLVSYISVYPRAHLTHLYLILACIHVHSHSADK